MSIFESFTLLFQSNAEDVEEGADKAEKTSEKLEKKLTKVDKEAKKAGDSFSALAQKAAGYLLPFLGLGALKGLVFDFAANADAAGKLATSLRMDVEQLQGWQGAVKKAGGDVEGFNGSVKGLNDKLKELARTGGGDAGYALWRLGINARDGRGKLKDTEGVLLSLADKLNGMERNKAIRLTEKLGLDEGTIDLLRKGRAGVEELVKKQRELGAYSKKDAEEARKFNGALDDLGRVFTFIGGIIASAMLPGLTWITEKFTGFVTELRKHKNLVMGFFIGLSAVLGVLAVKAGIAFFPFLLFAALILGVAAAFAVLYDDVQAFLNGHNSMIGKISKDYPWVGELVRQIADALGIMWQVAKAVFTFLADSISDPIAAMQTFRATVDPLIEAFCTKFPKMGQAIKDVGAIFGWLKDAVAETFELIFGLIWHFRDEIMAVIDGILGGLGKGLNFVAELIRSGDDEEPKDAPAPQTPLPRQQDVDAGVLKGQQALATTGTPLGVRSLNSPDKYMQNVNKTNTIKIDNVNVQTQATDAQGMASGVGTALQNELKAAHEQFDDGVAG